MLFPLFSNFFIYLPMKQENLTNNGNNSINPRNDGTNNIASDDLLYDILRDNPSCPVNPVYKAHGRGDKIFKKSSKVIPDQTYTVRELFERAVLNSMPEGLERPYYVEDTSDVDELFNRSGIDLSSLDLVELDELKSSLDTRITELKSKFQ